MSGARTLRRIGPCLLLLLAATACRRQPAPADLLGTTSGLREANVAGRPLQWVLEQIPQNLRLNDVVWRTLPASPPSRLKYVVDVPKGAHLTFACGVDPKYRGHPAIEFIVKVAARGRETRVFSQLLDPLRNPLHRRWVEADVDLSGHAGPAVELIFETHGYQETGEADVAYWGAPALTAPRTAPLVVLYLVDTLRADHTSVYGYRRDTTPHLAEFARDAVVFDQAIAQSSWTKPSVASILTSLTPHRHQVVQLGAALDVKLLSLPERLEVHGFTTGAAIANVVIYGRDTHFDQGFHFYAGLHDLRDRASKTVPAGPVVDTALHWLDARRGHSQFLFVHTMDPHVPYTPPAPFDRMFEPHPQPGHPANDPRTDAHEPLDRERFIAQYDGEIAYGDHEFGRFIAALKERGLYDQALIVFVSDHGEEFLEHGQWLHGRSVFDELVRVPLLVKFPGGRHAGQRIAQQVQLVDIGPTILQTLGLPVPPAPEIDGQPLQAVIAGQAPPRPALSEITHRGYVAYGLRTEKDKYVQRFSPEEDAQFGKAHELFFDLTRDPQEQVNRADESAERVRQARPLLAAAYTPSPFRTRLRITGSGAYRLRVTTRGQFESVTASGLGNGGSTAQERPGELTVTSLTGGLAAREIHFSVRPLGAPVWVEGTRDGRPLPPTSVLIGEQGVRPAAVPFRAPEAEQEQPQRENVFAAPRSTAAGVHVWIEPTAGQPAPAPLDRAHCEQLKELGYVTDCPTP